MSGNDYFGHWGLATQKETQIMKSWRWHDTQSVTMISLPHPCNVLTNKKISNSTRWLSFVWSFVDKLEHERSRREGGWMAADKPAPSSTLKLPARTNRDLLELWFLQSLNFKKSSFPKCFLKVLPSQFWIIHLKDIQSKSLKMCFWQLPTASKFIIILPHKLSERIKLSKVTKCPSTDIDILAQPQLGWLPPISKLTQFPLIEHKSCHCHIVLCIFGKNKQVLLKFRLGSSIAQKYHSAPFWISYMMVVTFSRHIYMQTKSVHTNMSPHKLFITQLTH